MVPCRNDRGVPWCTALPRALARWPSATGLPGGFADEVVLGGFEAPTAFRLAPDGRVLVAEKSGVIRVFDDLHDTTPTVSAGLHVNVHNYDDSGLLGMALDPGFPMSPYLYVLSAYDHRPGTVRGRRARVRDRRPAQPADRLGGRRCR